VVHIVDDILTMITFADENTVMSALPRYVADSPDRLPSARLYEGDMALLVALVKKAVHDIGLQMRKPSSP